MPRAQPLQDLLRRAARDPDLARALERRDPQALGSLTPTERQVLESTPPENLRQLLEGIRGAPTPPDTWEPAPPSRGLGADLPAGPGGPLWRWALLLVLAVLALGAGLAWCLTSSG